jgi:hypothetical protein
MPKSELCLNHLSLTHIGERNRLGAGSDPRAGALARSFKYYEIYVLFFLYTVTCFFCFLSVNWFTEYAWL